MAYYKDIDPKYVAGELVGYNISENLVAVKNALRNLFTIEVGEVPGKPWLGNPVSIYLFDNINFFDERAIETAFENTIQLYEPRVRLIKLKIDSAPEYNRLTVYMEYIVLINNTETFDNLRFSLAHNEMTAIATRNS